MLSEFILNMTPHIRALPRKRESFKLKGHLSRLRRILSDGGRGKGDVEGGKGEGGEHCALIYI